MSHVVLEWISEVLLKLITSVEHQHHPVPPAAYFQGTRVC